MSLMWNVFDVKNIWLSIWTAQKSLFSSRSSQEDPLRDKRLFQGPDRLGSFLTLCVIHIINHHKNCNQYFDLTCTSFRPQGIYRLSHFQHNHCHVRPMSKRIVVKDIVWHKGVRSNLNMCVCGGQYYAWGIRGSSPRKFLTE